MIKTKSIYEPRSVDDGKRILITRYYPRGVKKTHFDEWVRVLSPSAKLLSDIKEGKIEWEVFEERFRDELANSAESIKMIEELHDKIKGDTITLLCYEKSGKPCHRHFVREIIKDPKKLDKRVKFALEYIDDSGSHL